MGSDERRQYERYDTEVKIYFYVNYEIKTKVDYRVMDKGGEVPRDKKHHALSKDVSAQGMCFISNEKLNNGDQLYLEVYLPRAKKP